MRYRISRLLAGVRGLLRGTEESEGLVAAAPDVPVGEVLRRFWPYARPYRRWMPIILLLAALGPAIEAATIWMYKILVDEVLVPREFGLLVWVVLAYIALTLAEGFVTFCDDYLSELVGGRFVVSCELRFSVTCKVSPWISSTGEVWAI